MSRQASLQRQLAAATAGDPAVAGFDAIASALLASKHAGGAPPVHRPRRQARCVGADDHPRATIARVLAELGSPDGVAAAAARRICSAFAGEIVYFPLRDPADREHLASQVRAEHAAGAAIAELARRHGRSVSTVRRWCRSAD